MQHQIDHRSTSLDFTGDRLEFVVGELRRLCGLLGFKLEPHSSDANVTVAPVSFSPSGREATAHDKFDPEFQHRRARARAVRAEIKRRRQRDRFFPPDFFADPAWDILLDLYAAHYEDRLISVSSACIAAAVPSTTALRWLKTLSDKGQIVRVPDPNDGRRIFVAISDSSLKTLDAYFKEIED